MSVHAAHGLWIASLKRRLPARLRAALDSLIHLELDEGHRLRLQLLVVQALGDRCTRTSVNSTVVVKGLQYRQQPCTAAAGAPTCSTGPTPLAAAALSSSLTAFNASL